ncbi:Lipopolysaccharide export system ATP-binding protein LptB [Nonomuraea coxensis DSM 45129]|uniref:Lipopolysaccharide export system ATP-binding protein LptB n=1 Tax=Nonomuraea coxensis DSM 45129 TaxID=1122611 RepID=A0ABX8U6Z9_9ACTN|nr:ABC transporter ATP-binding protein [Nonomuraea coxensis]QYC42432.1 Lipopolysaccharide export system ATP-binding protein LptB [Nonomuraea coxensis DSM 45129]
MAALLEVSGLTMRFGGVTALAGVDLAVGEGELVGLIGPNGAGKSTLFDCLTRRCAPQEGRVLLAGEDLARLPAHGVAGHGVGRTFQNTALFPGLSVRENVMAGAHRHGRAGFWAAALGLAAGEERRLRGAADALLARFGLDEYADHPPEALPYGTTKLVEIARALASGPRLLLLDEPAGGLAPAEVPAFAGLIRRLHAERRLTIVVVEHHLDFVLSLCRRIVCLERGHKIADGPAEAVRRDPAVVAAFLGTGR